MRILSSCSAFAIGSLLSSGALAGEEGGSGPRHEGFMLRLTLGAGGAVTQNDLTPEIELSGGTGFFSLDLGGTVAERLALHVRLSAHAMVDPQVSIDGEDLGELSDASLSFALLGIGISYHFPSNLYLTGVVGVSSATLEVAGQEFDSDAGYGLVGDLGYEWATGGDWGLGVAGRLEYHSIPDDPDRLTAVALGVLFSATYH